MRPSLDLIEPRGEVRRGLGLGADRVEVGRSCVLALAKGDELVAGAFDDSERNEIAGHFPKWAQVSVCVRAGVQGAAHFCYIFLIYKKEFKI